MHMRLATDGIAAILVVVLVGCSQPSPFFLQKGENPDNVKLNLVIKGKGTAWIDDIRVMQGPLG